MKKYILILFVFLLIPTAALIAQQVIPYTQVNTPGEDFAVTFRSTCNGTEVWFTASSPGNPREKKLYIAELNRGQINTKVEAPAPVNQIPVKGAKIAKDGSPSFSACLPDIGVFVSNRLFNGKDYDNDLYELEKIDNVWTVRRLDALNSDAWDDTPSLSPDGRFIYFASDRLRKRTGQSDLFMSQRDEKGGWTQPEFLYAINAKEGENFRTETPLAASDGFLYYASDETGDADIYRVQLDPITGKPISGTKQPVPFAGVNKKGSDENHPAFSPGAGWFVYSFRQTKQAPADLYYTLVRQDNDTIRVYTTQQTKFLNPETQEYEDSYPPFKGSVVILDPLDNKSYTASCDDKGVATVIVPRAVGANPAEDKRIRELVVKAKVELLDQISREDTIYFEVGARQWWEHQLQVLDRSQFTNPDCRKDFPLVNVQFFVTGYWCPTSQDYRGYGQCASVFEDPACSTIETPDKPCEDNDIFTYRVIPAKIDKVVRPGLCIKDNEVRDNAQNWSKAVDGAIKEYIRKMGLALEDICVRRSVKEIKPITVEIYGYTDPRSINFDCEYTGKDLDFSQYFVRLDSTEKKKYIVNGKLKRGTKFAVSRFGGNEMLSDLRAFHTALILDSLWSVSVPKYAELKAQKLLQVVAIGKSIDQEDKAFEKRRSVKVSVLASVDKKPLERELREFLGSNYALGGNACLTNLLCKTLEKTSPAPIEQPLAAANAVYTSPTGVVYKEGMGGASATIEQRTEPIAVKKEPTIQSSMEEKALPGCFYVVFTSNTDEAKTDEVLLQLVKAGVPNIRKTTYISKRGVVYYRVVSACRTFQSEDERREFHRNAKNTMKKLGFSPDNVDLYQ